MLGGKEKKIRSDTSVFFWHQSKSFLFYDKTAISVSNEDSLIGYHVNTLPWHKGTGSEKNEIWWVWFLPLRLLGMRRDDPRYLSSVF